MGDLGFGYKAIDENTALIQQISQAKTLGISLANAIARGDNTPQTSTYTKLEDIFSSLISRINGSNGEGYNQAYINIRQAQKYLVTGARKLALAKQSGSTDFKAAKDDFIDIVYFCNKAIQNLS